MKFSLGMCSCAEPPRARVQSLLAAAEKGCGYINFALGTQFRWDAPSMSPLHVFPLE